MKRSVSSLLKRMYSRHFKTSFAMLFFLSHCFLLIGFFLWVNHFQSAVTEKAQFQLTSLLRHTEKTLATAKDNALFVGTLPSVQSALLSPKASLGQLTDLSNDLSPFVNLMAYESFTLSFRQSDIIYDTKAGLYSTENFYNPLLLERFHSRTREEYWEFGHPYQHYYDNISEHHNITYLHSLPIFGSEKYGFISVNLPLPVLTNYFQSYHSELGEEVLLYFQNKLLWSTDKRFARYQENIDLGNSFYAAPQISLQSSLFPMVQAETYFPRNYIWKKFIGFLPVILPSYLLLILFNYIGALLYSCYHLNKLDLFLHKIGMSGYSDFAESSLPEKEKATNSKVVGKRFAFEFSGKPPIDEFQLLNQAADHFQTQITNIRRTIADSKPLLQERLLTNILYHHVDVHRIPSEYQEYDISFPHPYFCIVLMAIQEIESVATTTIKEEIKLVAKENACQMFASIGKVYSIYSEKENLLFLLNTVSYEGLQEQIHSIATALKKGMRESLGFHLLFSVAFCDPENPVPYYAWTKARKNLIFTSGSADSFIIFSQQESHATALMPSFIFQITQAVIDKDLPRLESILEHFYKENLPDLAPVSTARKTLLLAAASVFSSLLEMDVLFSMAEMNQMVRKIEQSDNLSQSKELFHAYLAGLITTENKISGEAQEYIRQTLHYLEKHFAEPITIPQIAENVNINPIYLNKLFKLSTGKTLSEYLNYYRTEKSKEMLLHTDMTVNDISKSLGYNDVRSYIRFFKKFYHVTPNHFRKTEKI